MMVQVLSENVDQVPHQLVLTASPGLASTLQVLKCLPLAPKGSPDIKKNGKKRSQCDPRGGVGGSPPIPFFSPNLPGPKINGKWTMHTDKFSTTCHICAYLPARWLNVQDLGLASHDSEGSEQ